MDLTIFSTFQLKQMFFKIHFDILGGHNNERMGERLVSVNAISLKKIIDVLKCRNEDVFLLENMYKNILQIT